MTSKVDSLVPLAQVDDDHTLSSSKRGDEFFLVHKDGTSEKLQLNRACYLYSQAMDKGALVRDKPIRRRRAKTQDTSDDDSSASWREELRKKLGYNSDD